MPSHFARSALVAFAVAILAAASSNAEADARHRDNSVRSGAFSVVGNYWAQAGPDLVAKVYVPDRFAASYERPGSGNPYYRVTIQMFVGGDEHDAFVDLGSRTPIEAGSYYVGPGTDLGFDYAADHSDHEGASGVVRILQANFGSGGQVQLGLTFAIRDRGQIAPVYGAVGYDTTVPMTVPGETAKYRFGDFTGDGLTDVAVYRHSTGAWYIRGKNRIHYGNRPEDVPVPGDYNGDGRSDIAVYRPSTGVWYVRGMPSVRFGGELGDVPVPGDYNGDGKTDFAIFRPSNGKWYVHGQSSVVYGKRGDLVAQSDYDGNGTTDISVFNPSAGVTHIYDQQPVALGKAGDLPVPAYYPYYGEYGTYYNDGRSVVSLFRPATGTWLITPGVTLTLGKAGDVPVPGDWDIANPYRFAPAVYRPSSGTWYLDNAHGIVKINYGMPGDVPV